MSSSSTYNNLRFRIYLVVVMTTVALYMTIYYEKIFPTDYESLEKGMREDIAFRGAVAVGSFSNDSSCSTVFDEDSKHRE